MKKLLSILLALAMVLTILPMSAFAADETDETVETFIINDDNYKDWLRAGILGLNTSGVYYVNFSVEAMRRVGEFARLINILINEFITVSGGEMSFDYIVNGGTVADGVFSGVTGYNEAGGEVSISLYFVNEGEISGGTFNGTVENKRNISGGTFNGTVENKGTISDGTFNESVQNKATISDGTFNELVINYGTIEGGTFTGKILNMGGTVASGVNATVVEGGDLGIAKEIYGTGEITVKQNGIDIPSGKAGEVYNVAGFEPDTLVGLYMLREGEAVPTENFSIDEDVFTPFYYLESYLTHYDFEMPNEPVRIVAVFSDYEYVAPTEISIYPWIMESTEPEYIENGEVIWDYGIPPLTDFSQEITLPGEYIENTITIDDNRYEFAGFIHYSDDEETNIGTYSLLETYTIAPEPSDKESEEWFDWFTPISDGIYAAYILASDTHEHYVEDENAWNANTWEHWKTCDGCGVTFDRTRHNFTQLRICTICGQFCEHWNKITDNNELYHWDFCTNCSTSVSEETRHTDTNGDKVCDTCAYDMSKWNYFGFSNSYNDFFAAGEKRNYDVQDYEDDLIEWVGERYNYPGWRNDMQAILDMQDRDWGGSCYGYAVVECLYNIGLLDFNEYNQAAHFITDFLAPSKVNDKDIRSLLNYYWLTQFLTACRTDTHILEGLSGAVGRAEMLKFADYIVNGQNKAMFSYYFSEDGYTYGHAFVVDGGVKKEDGSYILNACDNRYHGYKWMADDTDVYIQIVVDKNGNAKVYSPGGRVYKDRMTGTMYEFEEIIEAFEYRKANGESFEIFQSLLPWDEDMLDVSTGWVYVPKMFLLPASAQGTANMTVSTDTFEVCVNDFIDGDKETDAIGKSYMITGGLSAVLGDELANENAPAGVMIELNTVADSYTIASPQGTVALSSEDGLTTLITDGAASAEFDTESGVVSVDNNQGEFLITVVTEDGTIARVRGTANGDITVTPKEDTIELDAPSGTYAVEYTKTDNTVTEDTIRIGSTSTGGGGVSRYTVKFDTDGGTKIANESVTRNSKVAEPTAPTKDGYTFNGWYTDEELTEKYDFNSKVTKSFTLYAKWEKHDDEQPVTPEWKNPFTDVGQSDWFFEDVKFVNENGLMNGTTDTSFAPDTNITRAMLVTVLYRLEGEPATNRSIPFVDVDMGAYYGNAVSWAKANGIVSGVTETEFAPNDNITREQIAAIMHRYAKFKGYDVTVGENTNILSYDDFADISEYAIAPMQYAAGSGLMKGKTESTLNPKDNATRAEIAAILHRFIEANK